MVQAARSQSAWPATSAGEVSRSIRSSVCWNATASGRCLPPQASACTGAFVLAAPGLLDGRRVTTHWLYAPLLASRWPQLTVEADQLDIEGAPIVTSAGSAAAIDLCLHLMRREHGAEVTNRIARHMVVPPHRDGGQSQYIRDAGPPTGHLTQTGRGPAMGPPAPRPAAHRQCPRGSPVPDIRR